MAQTLHWVRKCIPCAPSSAAPELVRSRSHAGEADVMVTNEEFHGFVCIFDMNKFIAKVTFQKLLIILFIQIHTKM